MQASNSFKKAFLKHMLTGLQVGGLPSKSMSFLERKRVIKTSADIAMAFAREDANWSRALITNLSTQEENKTLVKSVLGNEYERLTKPCYKWKIPTSKKILRRSFRVHRRIRKGAPAPHGVAASVLARRLVKKRTQVLKRLIPGGESLDDFSLLEETLDYVISLKAQVDLLRRLTNAVEVSNHISNMECTLQEKEYGK